MKFAFVKAEKANHAVGALCRAVDVSRAGFYAWLRRSPSARQKRDTVLDVLVRSSFAKSRCTYGSPRVHADLAAQGEAVGRKRIARLMRDANLVARRRKRYRYATSGDAGHAVPGNVLDRDFTATRPNERWVGDTTELMTSGSRLFLAVLLDLYSRRVVGWEVSTVNDRHLVMRALSNALRQRRPERGLLHHTDQGSPYASDAYQKLLETNGVAGSMSRRGNCYDNAVAEAFFATIKAELGERFDSPRAAKAALFDYIEVFYNQQRRHSTLDLVSPAEYERRAAQPSLAA